VAGKSPTTKASSKSDPEAPAGPLILLDGMSLAFRAYFALPPDLATSSGVVTNAVHGFTSMVVNLVRDHHPVGLAVAFDLPGGTFRDEITPDYKAGRSDTPPDLPPQFEMIRAVLDSLAKTSSASNPSASTTGMASESSTARIISNWGGRSGGVSDRPAL
jgi:DNA polymerase I